MGDLSPKWSCLTSAGIFFPFLIMKEPTATLHVFVKAPHNKELNAGLEVKTARGISEACSTVRHFKFCNFERRGKPCHPILLLTSEGASCPCSLLTYRARCSGPRHVHCGAAVPSPSHLSAQNNCLDFVTSSREESKGDNFC